MKMYHHPSPAAASDGPKRKASATAAGGGASKKRGSYNCGRCGLPKKGHICQSTGSPVIAAASPSSDAQRLRRALSFDEDLGTPAGQAEEIGGYVPLADVPAAGDEVGDEMDGDLGGVVLPGRLLVEVLRRLPPKELMAAAGVCRGWKECVGRVWKAAEELRIRVPRRSQVGFVGSVLQKCGSLARLSLRMERLGFLIQVKQCRLSVNG